MLNICRQCKNKNSSFQYLFCLERALVSFRLIHPHYCINWADIVDVSRDYNFSYNGNQVKKQHHQRQYLMVQIEHVNSYHDCVR